MQVALHSISEFKPNFEFASLEVKLQKMTENDHDPEITCLAHEDGAEGAKYEYEKNLQYNS